MHAEYARLRETAAGRDADGYPPNVEALIAEEGPRGFWSVAKAAMENPDYRPTPQELASPFHAMRQPRVSSRALFDGMQQDAARRLGKGFVATPWDDTTAQAPLTQADDEARRA